MSAPDAERPAPPEQDRRSFSESHTGDRGQSRVPLHRIRRHLYLLDLATLGTYLAEVEVDHDGRTFYCPRCQATEAKQTLNGPAAYVDADGYGYRCGNCGEVGTADRVAAAVLRRPSAFRRVADRLAGEVVR